MKVIVISLILFAFFASSCSDEVLEWQGRQITVSELRAESFADIEKQGWDVACAKFIAMTPSAISEVITTGIEFGYFPDVKTGTRILTIHKEVCYDVR